MWPRVPLLETLACICSGLDDRFTDPCLAKPFDDVLVHDIIHACEVELPKRHGIIHPLASQFDEIVWREAATPIETLHSRRCNSGGTDDSHLLLGLRRATDEKKGGS